MQPGNDAEGNHHFPARTLIWLDYLPKLVEHMTCNWHIQHDVDDVRAWLYPCMAA